MNLCFGLTFKNREHQVICLAFYFLKIKSTQINRQKLLKQTDTVVHKPAGSLYASHLPDSYVCCRVGEGPLEHAAHLEGVGVNLSDVVQHHQDSGQRVDAGEQTDVTEQQEQLQVVIECALREGEAQTDIWIYAQMET